ncbi:glycosyltransferase family 2 protein [Burkholderia pyrrocinia]|uniref:glycosyltransferase family 2 protein n=1 Tax=Burkholderia pyrrocinia TaxID=60550 RepID=UPI0030CA654E
MIAAVVDGVLMLAAVASVVPALTLLAEVGMSVRRARRNWQTGGGPGSGPEDGQEAGPESVPRPSIAVIVPAHDESRSIAATLDALLPDLTARDRVVVVADNCSDDTAAIAARLGAEAISRVDAERRGKGFALEYGVAHLAGGAAPPDAVVFVDADCRVAPGAIARLAALACASGRPVQAQYLLRAPAGAGLGMRISEFAVRLKNDIRPRGGRHLGAPCQLAGSGMALPWPLVASVTLGTANLVEDLALGIDLTLAGRPPVYCGEALVTSELPTAASSHRVQRQRWEQGHLRMIGQMAPRLLLAAVRRRSWACLAAALDLLVLPLTLLVFCQALLVAVCAVAYRMGASGVPLLIQSAAAGMVASAVALAWLTGGRDLIGWRDWLHVGFYMVRKVPMYVGMALGRRTGWVRTDRE